MTRPAREALTVTLTATMAGVMVGALVWAVWITVQLARLIRALTILAEALTSHPL